jgi:lysozyme
METLAQRIERHEGRRHKLYRDTRGNLTGGVGRNMADGFRDDEIDLMRDNDIEMFIGELLKALPWVTKLDQLRHEVLVEMAFNMGIVTLLTFKRTLDQVQSGDYEAAAESMLGSLWAHQVGARATELAEIMRTGKAAR